MDRRVGKTKKAIQAAYFDLLKEKGNEKISVTEIARAADIDRKTFYLHYESTDQIIREFAKAKTKELLLRLTVKSFFLRSFDKEIFAREANAMLGEHLEFAQMLARNPNLNFFWSQVQDTSVEMLVEIYARHSKLPKSDLNIRVTYFVALLCLSALASRRDSLQPGGTGGKSQRDRFLRSTESAAEFIKQSPCVFY